MNISFTPNQERLIQSKIAAGKYRNVEEILEIALQLLEERDRSDISWVEDVRVKIDRATAVSEPPLDGEAFTRQILTRFQQ